MHKNKRRDMEQFKADDLNLFVFRITSVTYTFPNSCLLCPPVFTCELG